MHNLAKRKRAMKFVTVNSQPYGNPLSDWVGLLVNDPCNGSEIVINLIEAANKVLPSEDVSCFSDMITLINMGELSITLAQKLVDSLEIDNLISHFGSEISGLSVRSPLPIPPQIRDCLYRILYMDQNQFKDHNVAKYLHSLN